MDGKTNSQSQPLWVEGQHFHVPEPEKYEYVQLSEFQLTKHDKKQTKTMSTVRVMNK